jgi:hypothetical protein
VEHFTLLHFKIELLALITNIRPTRKTLPVPNTLAFRSSDKEKKVYSFGTKDLVAVEIPQKNDERKGQRLPQTILGRSALTVKMPISPPSNVGVTSRPSRKFVAG